MKTSVYHMKNIRIIIVNGLKRQIQASKANIIHQ